jgi:hypothetical protein
MQLVMSAVSVTHIYEEVPRETNVQRRNTKVEMLGGVAEMQSM